MFGRKTKRESATGTVDGGEGRGVPLGGHDDRPPTGYRSTDDEVIEPQDVEDRDLLWEDGDPADRRRDPLRKP